VTAKVPKKKKASLPSREEQLNHSVGKIAEKKRLAPVHRRGGEALTVLLLGERGRKGPAEARTQRRGGGKTYGELKGIAFRGKKKQLKLLPSMLGEEREEGPNHFVLGGSGKRG